jgi:hypothetical protein
MSLAVHGASAVAPVFNATFYATAAAVIPVLFLALAVQGRGFGALLSVATAAREEADMLPARVLQAAGVVIVTAGFFGEAAAMYDLYASSGVGGILILVAALILLLAVVVGPFAALVVSGHTAAEWAQRRSDAAAPAPETPPAAP